MGSVAASGLVSLRKIFRPTKFSYPPFRGSGPRSSTRSIPSARPSSTVFRLIKPPVARIFSPPLTPCISQRARSPAHSSHRADKVLGSVTSVRTSVRSVKKAFLQKSVIAAASVGRRNGFPVELVGGERCHRGVVAKHVNVGADQPANTAREAASCA